MYIQYLLQTLLWAGELEDKDIRTLEIVIDHLVLVEVGKTLSHLRGGGGGERERRREGEREREREGEGCERERGRGRRVRAVGRKRREGGDL